jgi:hypothetical protein
VNETEIGEWIYTTLTGDDEMADLVGEQVYHGLAPKEATFPRISFRMQTGVDVAAVGTKRILANQVWLVRAIGQTGSYSDLGPIAERIGELLEGVHGTVGVACIREQPFMMEESIDGVQYRHLGGLYRIITGI